MQPPAGFTRVERDGAVVVVRSALEGVLLDAGIADPVGLVARAPSRLAGRGRLASVDLGPAGRAVVRPLLRGGALGWLVRRLALGGLSLDRGRALAELVVSAEAAARGARVLDVLAAVTRPGPLGFTHGLVTREVEGARDLMAVLEREPAPARRAALLAAGRAVRRLHDAGVDHVDLNLKNILLAPDGEALVIDLDRCRLGQGPASDAVREANLLRLLRSWTKLGVRAPGAVRPRDPFLLLRGYAPGRAERPRRRALVAAARARGGFGCRRVVWRWLG